MEMIVKSWSQDRESESILSGRQIWGWIKSKYGIFGEFSPYFTFNISDLATTCNIEA